MAQFTLVWDNTDVLANANAISQRALYRKKSVGGAFISAGFTPTNDLATSETTTDSPSGLDDNNVYEFKIQSICTLGGPTDNDNGIIEAINFACIDPDLEQTEELATATLNLTDTNITKVKFELKRSLDDVLFGTAIVNKVANSATKTFTGLAADTNYYWEITLYANINNAETNSANVIFLGAPCGPYPITTDEEPICDPVTSVTVTSIEL